MARDTQVLGQRWRDRRSHGERNRKTNPEASRAGDTEKGVRDSRRAERGREMGPGLRSGQRHQGCSLQSALRPHFLQGTHGCGLGVPARVCLHPSPSVCQPSGHGACAVGQGTPGAVFLSPGVSVCVVWCVWVCPCGLPRCVARHVCPQVSHFPVVGGSVVLHDTEHMEEARVCLPVL
jgi:hypothetical protein